MLNGYDIVAKEIYDRYRNIGWSIRSLVCLYKENIQDVCKSLLEAYSPRQLRCLKELAIKSPDRNSIQLFQKRSQNLKFKNYAKNFETQILKIGSSFFAHWHIDHVYQVSWESDKNCKKSSDLKRDNIHTHWQTDTSTTYTISWDKKNVLGALKIETNGWASHPAVDYPAATIPVLNGLPWKTFRKPSLTRGNQRKPAS